MAWMWCSFCDPDLPEGTQFLGVAILEGDNVMVASVNGHLLGVNPGGEVMALPIPDNMTPGPEWRNRLLTRAETETLDAEMAARRSQLN